MKKDNPLRAQLEQLDINIIFLLNKVRRKIEELRRTIPYSKEKVKWSAVVQYWKARIRRVNRRPIDRYAMENRERYLETIETDLLIEEMKNRLNIAKEKWKKLLQIG